MLVKVKIALIALFISLCLNSTTSFADNKMVEVAKAEKIKNESENKIKSCNDHSYSPTKPKEGELTGQKLPTPSSI